MTSQQQISTSDAFKTGQNFSKTYQTSFYISGIVMVFGDISSNVDEVILYWIFADLSFCVAVNSLVVFLWAKRRDLVCISPKDGIRFLFRLISVRPIRHILFVLFISALYFDGRPVISTMYLFLFAISEFQFIQRLARARIDTEGAKRIKGV